eukprot:1163943-Amphidinium_carterae.1
MCKPLLQDAVPQVSDMCITTNSNIAMAVVSSTDWLNHLIVEWPLSLPLAVKMPVSKHKRPIWQSPDHT